MKKLCLLLFSIFLFTVVLKAQEANDSLAAKKTPETIQQTRDTDTVKKTPVPVVKTNLVIRDTIKRVIQDADTISRRPIADSLLLVFGKGNFWQEYRAYTYSRNSLFGFSTPIIAKSSDIKVFHGKEDLFYYFVFVLVLFGLIRVAFGSYFTNLFRVFFRTTLKQKQIREQLLQSALPSIMMNIFFVIIAGMYVNLFLQFLGLSMADNFWLQYLYCMLGLGSIYLLKFIGLKISGWLFNMGNAADSYIFIVFIINKMIGILLLPLVIFIGFTTEPVYGFAMTLSWVGLVLLYVYRFILSYSVVRNEIRLNPFHFLVYLAAFEIIPLLLIYKLLLLIF